MIHIPNRFQNQSCNDSAIDWLKAFLPVLNSIFPVYA